MRLTVQRRHAGAPATMAIVLLVGVLVLNRPANGDMRLTEAAALKSVVEKENPTYPPVAKQLKISGKVELEVVVDTDGTVESATVKTGHPMLANACTAAVKKWKFTPFTQEGKPTKVIFRIGFSFAL